MRSHFDEDDPIVALCDQVGLSKEGSSQLSYMLYTIDQVPEYNKSLSNIEVQQWMAIYKYMNTNCFDPTLAEFTCHSNATYYYIHCVSKKRTNFEMV